MLGSNILYVGPSKEKEITSHLKKTTFDGRKPLMEDELWWKMTLDGRSPWMEDNLGWKTTLDGRLPLMKDGLGWKMTHQHVHVRRKDDIFWQRRQSIHHVLCIVHHLKIKKTTCPCRSCIQRLHYPAFANFFYDTPNWKSSTWWSITETWYFN